MSETTENRTGSAVRGKPSLSRCLTYRGLVMIRHARRVRRWVLRLLLLLWSVVLRIWHRIARAFVIFAVRNGLDHNRATERLQRIHGAWLDAKKQGGGAVFRFLLWACKRSVQKFFGLFVSSPSYSLPIAALAIFIFVVHTTLNLTFALHIEYNGNDVGYIANESVYEKAEIQMRSRIAYEEYIRPDDAIPVYTITAVKADELLSVNELTDELIRASGNELAEATGLYVDGEFIGAASSESELTALLNSLLEPYKTDSEDEVVTFVKDVQTVTGLYPLTSIQPIRQIHDTITGMEQEERIYTAVAGDSPILIAQKNGITTSLLRSLNPGIDDSLLIGQEVLVQKSVPFLQVKVVRTEVYTEEVAYKTVQTVDPDQYEGYTKTTQTGRNGENEITAEVSYLDGVEISREIISTVVLSEPREEHITVGGKSVASVGTSASSSGFIWPAAGGYISCHINGYRGHTGTDIAANAGTAIYAAASGVVTKVAYNRTGYGYHIIINHGGNIETLYAHCSKLYVTVGQWVSQGDVIAAMGRTGNATGNHVHFEIRSNGKYLNPVNYIGYTCPY